MPPTADTRLRNKYNITKADGSPTDPNADYFVLRLDKDPAARVAALAYADAVEATAPMLADDLRRRVLQYQNYVDGWYINDKGELGYRKDLAGQ